jgi:hypothetical protein
MYTNNETAVALATSADCVYTNNESARAAPEVAGAAGASTTSRTVCGLNTSQGPCTNVADSNSGQCNEHTCQFKACTKAKSSKASFCTQHATAQKGGTNASFKGPENVEGKDGTVAKKGKKTSHAKTKQQSLGNGNEGYLEVSDSATATSTLVSVEETFGGFEATTEGNDAANGTVTGPGIIAAAPRERALTADSTLRMCKQQTSNGACGNPASVGLSWCPVHCCKHPGCKKSKSSKVEFCTGYALSCHECSNIRHGIGKLCWFEDMRR